MIRHLKFSFHKYKHQYSLNSESMNCSSSEIACYSHCMTSAYKKNIFVFLDNYLKKDCIITVNKIRNQEKWKLIYALRIPRHRCTLQHKFCWHRHVCRTTSAHSWATVHQSYKLHDDALFFSIMQASTCFQIHKKVHLGENTRNCLYNSSYI